MLGKSLHLATLKSETGLYKIPKGIAIPFGVFEKILKFPENAEEAGDIAAMTMEEDWEGVRQVNQF